MTDLDRQEREALIAALYDRLHESIVNGKWDERGKRIKGEFRELVSDIIFPPGVANAGDSERPDERRFRVSVNPQSGELSVTQIAGEPMVLTFSDDDRAQMPPSVEAIVLARGYEQEPSCTCGTKVDVDDCEVHPLGPVKTLRRGVTVDSAQECEPLTVDSALQAMEDAIPKRARRAVDRINAKRTAPVEQPQEDEREWLLVGHAVRPDPNGGWTGISVRATEKGSFGVDGEIVVVPKSSVPAVRVHEDTDAEVEKP